MENAPNAEQMFRVGNMVIRHTCGRITKRTKKLLRYLVHNPIVKTKRLGKILRYPLAMEHADGAEQLDVNEDWICIQRMMYISMSPHEYQTAKDLLRGITFEFFANMLNDSSDNEDRTRTPEEQSEESDESQANIAMETNK